MATKLFQEMTAAEAAWNAGESNLGLLDALESAERRYFAAMAEARAAWAALPEGNRKDVANENATQTPGTHADELYWFEMALGTYQLHE